MAFGSKSKFQASLQVPCRHLRLELCSARKSHRRIIVMKKLTLWTNVHRDILFPDFDRVGQVTRSVDLLVMVGHMVPPSPAHATESVRVTSSAHRHVLRASACVHSLCRKAKGVGSQANQTPLSHYRRQPGAEFEFFLVRPRVGTSLELLIFVVLWIGSAKNNPVTTLSLQIVNHGRTCSGPARLGCL